MTNPIRTNTSTLRRAFSLLEILVVLGILIEAFEIDFGVPGLGALAGSLYDATDGPLLDRIFATVVRRAPQPCETAPSDPPPRLSPVRLPIVVRRRPRVAHGLDDCDGTTLGSILIVG